MICKLVVLVKLETVELFGKMDIDKYVELEKEIEGNTFASLLIDVNSSFVACDSFSLIAKGVARILGSSVNEVAAVVSLMKQSTTLLSLTFDVWFDWTFKDVTGIILN